MIFVPLKMHTEMEIAFNVVWKLLETSKVEQFGNFHVL